MSDNDKDLRHGHDHDQDQDHDHGHAHRDDHGHDAAPRRVADADRKSAGTKTAHDVEAFLFKAEAHGKKSRISFGPSVAAATDEQAAFKAGVKGYVKLGKDHMLAQFTITDVHREGQGGNSITAHAIVDVPASELDRSKIGGLSVVVNPTSYPALAPRTQHDIKGRVQAIRREDDHKWLLFATAGLQKGVREGMTGIGYDANGKNVARLTVKTVDEHQCWVEIEESQDVSSSVKEVLINPS
jgi:hypothetical protein